MLSDHSFLFHVWVGHTPQACGWHVVGHGAPQPSPPGGPRTRRSTWSDPPPGRGGSDRTEQREETPSRWKRSCSLVQANKDEPATMDVRTAGSEGHGGYNEARIVAPIEHHVPSPWTGPRSKGRVPKIKLVVPKTLPKESGSR